VRGVRGGLSKERGPMQSSIQPAGVKNHEPRRTWQPESREGREPGTAQRKAGGSNGEVLRGHLSGCARASQIRLLGGGAAPD